MPTACTLPDKTQGTPGLPLIDAHVWGRVFSYLPSSDHFSVSLVCRQWNRVLSAMEAHNARGVDEARAVYSMTATEWLPLVRAVLDTIAVLQGENRLQRNALCWQVFEGQRLQPLPQAMGAAQLQQVTAVTSVESDSVVPGRWFHQLRGRWFNTLSADSSGIVRAVTEHDWRFSGESCAAYFQALCERSNSSPVSLDLNHKMPLFQSSTLNGYYSERRLSVRSLTLGPEFDCAPNEFGWLLRHAVEDSQLQELSVSNLMRGGRLWEMDYGLIEMLACYAACSDLKRLEFKVSMEGRPDTRQAFVRLLDRCPNIDTVVAGDLHPTTAVAVAKKLAENGAIRSLTLKECRWDMPQFLELMKELEQMRELEHLCVDAENLDYAYLIVLAHTVKKMPALKHVSAVGEAPVVGDPQIQALHLLLNDCDGLSKFHVWIDPEDIPEESLLAPVDNSQRMPMI